MEPAEITFWDKFRWTFQGQNVALNNFIRKFGPLVIPTLALLVCVYTLIVVSGLKTSIRTHDAVLGALLRGELPQVVDSTGKSQSAWSAVANKIQQIEIANTASK